MKDNKNNKIIIIEERKKDKIILELNPKEADYLNSVLHIELQLRFQDDKDSDYYKTIKEIKKKIHKAIFDYY